MGYLKRIRHETYWCRVNNDIVITLLQDIHRSHEIVTRQQLRGIRRHGTCQEQFKVVINAGGQYLAHHIILCQFTVCQQRRDTLRTV